MPKKSRYYTLDKILELEAHYNVIIGTRSTGKTYACLRKCIKDYAEHGRQAALVRRWGEDFRGKRGSQMFDSHINNGEVEQATSGQYNSIYYYGGRWFFCKMENGEREYTDPVPFAYGFAISAGEHDKSTSYPNITNIVFDEMVTRESYLTDEFILFENLLSTIIRDRHENIKIFMLGNTISQYCPYFKEMGLSHVKEMKEGDIDVYHYGDSKLVVAVEVAKADCKQSSPSQVFFAFDSPQLSMITGNGNLWEMAIYPHLPIKYKPKDIIMHYFIQFNGDILQCDIIQIDEQTFTFIHRKTTEIRHPETDIVYTPDYSPRPNFRRKITKPLLPIESKIAWYFRNDKVFYQDNEVGEIVRGYLQWCNK